MATANNKPTPREAPPQTTPRKESGVIGQIIIVRRLVYYGRPSPSRRRTGFQRPFQGTRTREEKQEVPRTRSMYSGASPRQWVRTRAGP